MRHPLVPRVCRPVVSKIGRAPISPAASSPLGSGVPQFSLGDRLVVFVTGNDHYAVPLVGLWQGVYRVVFDAARGVETIYSHARQPVTSLPTATGGILHDEGQLSSAVQQPASAMSLETFTAVIAQEVGHD